MALTVDDFSLILCYFSGFYLTTKSVTELDRRKTWSLLLNRKLYYNLLYSSDKKCLTLSSLHFPSDIPQ